MSILLSCLTTAPNQIFCKCCQQSPSKNFISTGEQPSFSARADISSISNRLNFLAVAQVKFVVEFTVKVAVVELELCPLAVHVTTNLQITVPEAGAVAV